MTQKEKRHSRYVKNKEKEYAGVLNWRKINPEKWRNTLSNRYASYLHGAENRGLLFEISRDEFKALYNKNCYYCGDIINGVGIDRVDNSMGYIKDNIVPCCETCNRMKLCQTVEDFTKQCEKIVNNLLK